MKKIVILCIVNILVIGIAANNKVYNSSTERKNNIDSLVEYSDCAVSIILSDTSCGIFVSYENTTQKDYKIKWGNRNIFKTSTQQFKYLGNGALELEYYDNYGVVLHQGCGSNCWYSVVLPLDEKLSEIRIDYLEAYDLSRSIIAYLSYDGKPNIVIKNYRNNQIQLSPVLKNCTCSAWDACIDSCKIVNNNLLVYLKKDLNSGSMECEKIKIDPQLLN